MNMFFKALANVLMTPLIFIGQFFGSAHIQTPPPVQMARPSSITPPTTTKKPGTTTPTVKPAVKKVSTTPKATTTPVKKVASKPAETPIISPIAPEPVPNFEQININSRKTIVNILCTTKYGGLSPISGTGVIINSDGLILTNAHIGQYFLLKDLYEKDYLKCVARTGSPAYPKYNLELVYISPNWVKENKTLLKEQNPKGTGENDFAFLKITGLIDNSASPAYYTYIQPNINENIKVGSPVLLVSYPAGFLGGLSILQDLNVTSSITNIQDVYTFKDGTIDVVSVGGTVVSQKGSSGGLVVDRNISLIGIITTSSDGNTTSSRGLNAITLPYINRSLQKEINMSLDNFISLDHSAYAENFRTNTAPELTKIITDELLK